MVSMMRSSTSYARLIRYACNNGNKLPSYTRPMHLPKKARPEDTRTVPVRRSLGTLPVAETKHSWASCLAFQNRILLVKKRGSVCNVNQSIYS